VRVAACAWTPRAALRVAILFLLLALPAAPAAAAATIAETGSAVALRASYARLADRLAASPFGAPLHLESTDAADELTGEVTARLDHPFERVRTALRRPQSWCDILLLHPNVTGCRLGAAAADGEASLTVEIGRMHEPATFAYRVAKADADYLDVRLFADEGPAGTTNYRIRLEATPLDEQHTALHLVYSHGYGVKARMTMRAYLATLGRGKVGFTRAGHDANGQPIYVDGFRGALERNAMRYYLCIEAYLDALSAAPERQFETRLLRWYAHSERYSPQLREERSYLDLKRRLAREMQSTS
jgi:hypothetical protein